MTAKYITKKLLKVYVYHPHFLWIQNVSSSLSGQINVLYMMQSTVNKIYIITLFNITCSCSHMDSPGMLPVSCNTLLKRCQNSNNIDPVRLQTYLESIQPEWHSWSLWLEIISGNKVVVNNLWALGGFQLKRKFIDIIISVKIKMSQC
jgi:hypothetical protein